MSTSRRTDRIIPTRVTLLNRIKNPEDNASWGEFYSIYRNLIFGVAKKCGVTDQEAEDVVQETMAAVAKHIKDFQYDPAKSFKAWLLKITRSKIANQFRARLPIQSAQPSPPGAENRTKTIERVANPTDYDIAGRWDEEWRLNLQEAALGRLRRTESAKQYQLFEAHVIKGWPVEKVMTAFGLKKADVIYQNKRRMTKALQHEIARLQEKLY